MTSSPTRVLAAIATLAAAIVLSSCGTAATQNQGLSASATSAEQVAAHNADDVMFAQMMIPHHQQAIEVAAMVPDRSSNPDVIALAATIVGEQQPEIDTMKALLLQWNVDPNEMSHESGHAGMAMTGMVNDATMVRLDSLKGASFDMLWLQSMISHHEGAIAMAKSEIADGKSADMTTVAADIVAAQQTEIDQIKQMLIGLGV
ncbi:DUF305 domain-containing protein [Mycolicibacterium sp.]|jgi:uncharacterized protein (DUF305 family)|uniref:DUF305 domain-containing protein n=1 Tax=Mycolicibacterium sp. TaxID=2320850 RepID=UPI001A21009A|nr:DUF305 domain-containing protein [Mycolicibacterium sp.]MBJ7399725.1 DUF305 domain-containing protein [Mycolicibacterium sp.]